MPVDSPTTSASAGTRLQERGLPARHSPSPRTGRRWRRSSVLVAAVGVALLAPAPALAVSDGGVQLVDRPTGFGELPFDGAAGAAVGPHVQHADLARDAGAGDGARVPDDQDLRGRDVRGRQRSVVDFITFEHSPTAAVTAPVVPVSNIVIPSPGGTDSGCEEEDYPA